MNRPVSKVLRILLLCTLGAPTGASQPAGYPFTPVPFADVHVHDAFWSKRLEVNRTVSIPHALRLCEETGRVRNFQVADSVLRGVIPEGTFCSRYGFDDSDVFKVIEGACYALHTKYDPSLDSRVDTLIGMIGRAQEPDGYLYTMSTMKAKNSWAKERWVNARTKGSHELYNLGHLYEAAVAHYQATGKQTLLDVALRSADLLVSTFGPEGIHTTPGHQVVEMGLAKLFTVTGNRSYLDLAKFFIEERGRGVPPGESYNQDQVPVLQQTEAVGHAVRAGYLYAGMADVASLAGDDRFMPVLERLWDDVVSRKLYITGGVGAVGSIEGYGPPYELPNLSAYCETCAGIALVYWSHRMFLSSGDAKYMDLVERVIYNGFLSGVDMRGNLFFYPNPLESFRGADRSPWFTCACCPSNDGRFVPSIPGYVYAFRKDSLYVNLFIGGKAAVRMPDRIVSVSQSTGYPWSGDVSIVVGLAEPAALTLHVRIPGWARNSPLPGDLYQYANPQREAVEIRINGRPVPVRLDGGYAVLSRVWNDGDTIAVTLPMGIHRVLAHPRVQDDLGKVALERGPIVYCLEGVDNSAGRVLDLVIPDTAALESRFSPDLLGGVQLITGFATPTHRTMEGTILTDHPVRFTAIPYFAWAHRGRSPMTVWPARIVEAAKPRPAPTIAARSSVSASAGTEVDAVADQILPRNSADVSVPRFNWWPEKGGTEWVQYDFDSTRRVSAVEVYWCDDGTSGLCRLPAKWTVLYRDEDDWRPVVSAGGYPTTGSTMNTVTFAPVETDALRLEVVFQEGCTAGLYEWAVLD